MALFKGIIIIACVITVNIVVAYLASFGSTASGPAIEGCSTTGNFTTCQETSKTSFLSSIFLTVITGVDGAPGIFNTLYVIVGGVFLIAGIIEIVRSFVPLLPGG